MGEPIRRSRLEEELLECPVYASGSDKRELAEGLRFLGLNVRECTKCIGYDLTCNLYVDWHSKKDLRG